MSSQKPWSPKPSTFNLGSILGPSGHHFLTFFMICHAFHATFFNFFSCRCPFHSKFMFSLCFSPIFQKLFIAVAASFCQLLAFKCFASTASILRCRRSLCVYNPLRVRGRTQQSVSGRFSPFAVSLSCTAPYLTSPFLYVISLGKCICRYPAIADARKGGFWEPRKLKMVCPSRFKTAPFFNFFKNHEKSWKIHKYNTFKGF